MGNKANIETVLQRIVDAVPSAPVRFLAAGLFDCLVESERSGLASTLRETGIPHQGLTNSSAGEGSDVREVAKLLLSDNVLEASMGMAAVNSAIAVAWQKTSTGKAQDLILEKGVGKRLGIVGHFPFIERLADRFAHVDIFEKQPRPGDLTEQDIPQFLPRADVVALTATSLTNHTFAELVAHIPRDAFVVMLGPTAPLLPLLFEYGIDAVCGAVVNEPDKVREAVLRGTPYRKLPGIEHRMLLKEDVD